MCKTRRSDRQSARGTVGGAILLLILIVLLILFIIFIIILLLLLLMLTKRSRSRSRAGARKQPLVVNVVTFGAFRVISRMQCARIRAAALGRTPVRRRSRRSPGTRNWIPLSEILQILLVAVLKKGERFCSPVLADTSR